MNKKNVVLIIIAVLLFCVAVGVVITVLSDVQREIKENPERMEETIEEKIDRKINEIKVPTTEGIDDNVVDEILTDKNKNDNTNLYVGENEGVTNVEDELVFVGQNEQNREKDNINKEYADFVVDTINEDEVFSLSNYESKPMVLMFWRSDVGDAIETLNVLNSAYEEYSEEVNFVCIDVSIGETSLKDDVQAYLSANDIKVDMYFDSNNAAIEAYNINYVPSVIFIDKNRNVINTKEGLLSYDTLEANLDLLTGKF